MVHSSKIQRLLVANRGEIAVRVLRAAAALGIETALIRSQDDGPSLATALADQVVVLPGTGVGAYLDIEAVVEAAKSVGVDAVHPGYGFLAENPELARACARASLTFVGPGPDLLALFGDKLAARRAAVAAGLPVLAGSEGPVDLAAATAMFEATGAVMLKAVAGGGGRGMRAVTEGSELANAFQRCGSEARAAFGDGALYVEQLVRAARHIEVQIVGDGTDVVQLGERDCSIQRRNQKVVEIAPAPALAPGLRHRLQAAAVDLGRSVGYSSLGTVEFLVDAATAASDDETPFWFIETNARIQVEHTITEEVTGVDLVEAQLRLASGATLAEVGLGDSPAVEGWSIQARINAETITADGLTVPSAGTITRFAPASGPGVRVDTACAAGVEVTPGFDSLLAKLIVTRSQGTFADTAARLYRALCETEVLGVATNLDLLRNVVSHPAFSDGAAAPTTTFVADNLASLTGPGEHRLATQATAGQVTAAHATAGQVTTAGSGDQSSGRGSTAQAGARLNSDDPLAVLAYGRSEAVGPVDGTALGGTALGGTALDGTALDSTALDSTALDSTALDSTVDGAAPGGPGAPSLDHASGGAPDHELDSGQVAVSTPLQGTVVTIEVAVGDGVAAGQLVAVVEAMKMEHEIRAPLGGTVERIHAEPGDTLWADQLLMVVAAGNDTDALQVVEEEIDLEEIRPSLAEVQALRARMMDDARPAAVERRRSTSQRTARENLVDLVDDGTFVEYGPMALAAQRRRRTREDLIDRSPADGLLTGVGSVNGEQFDDPTNRCAVMIYDYTVFAGTQGIRNHAKTDRIIDVASEGRMPFILYAEGGGGRPGDTDGGDFGSRTFSRFATMSGLVPMVGVVSGFCFAGNASLLGCCDVIIATRNANIGMGGPAMIEGGGLGVFRPEAIGPAEVHTANGVIDVLVDDEAEATAVAKKYLSYFQGPTTGWKAHDQRLLRRAIPENRLRTYDMHSLIHDLADVDSVLELRAGFGHGIVTALIRIEGKPIGVVANNPNHLGGAIDSDGADKGARFMQLCDAFDVPLLFLCDTPGIMVGPEVEKTALVRHANRMFLIGANVEVPTFTVIVRKAYGLGGIAMAGGSFKVPICSVAWPTAEFGPMGLEGSVKLGFRAELAAIEDPVERKARYDELVEKEYKRGKALNHATGFAIDDTIDPADTRYWLANIMASLRPPLAREGKKRAAVDGW